MRALLLVGVAVFLAGCSGERTPVRRKGEASPEELQVLHAGNERLAAKVTQYITQTKKTPSTLDEVKAWAGASWDASDDAAMVDPWGNKLLVHIPLSSTGHAVTLRSKGPDGKNSDDDLTYDSRDQQTRTEEQRGK